MPRRGFPACDRTPVIEPGGSGQGDPVNLAERGDELLAALYQLKVVLRAGPGRPSRGAHLVVRGGEVGHQVTSSERKRCQQKALDLAARRAEDVEWGVLKDSLLAIDMVGKGGKRMARYEFLFVVSGDEVDLTPEQQAAVASAIVEAGASQLGNIGKELPDAPAIVGPVAISPNHWHIICGRPLPVDTIPAVFGGDSF